MSLTGLHVLAPQTGGELSLVTDGAQGGGAYDIPNSRWYSASQGSLVCSEAH